jgi:metallo-beta-lactamase family protein
MSTKLTFYGGTGSVTGANFHIEGDFGVGLVDCGLEQGIIDHHNDPNYKPFPYDVSKVDFLIVTHAHIDHIGRIPKLVRDGFRGKIISTPATRDLSDYMLRDAFKVMTSEANRTGKDPMYSLDDVATALSLWKTYEFYVPFAPMGDKSKLEIIFRNSGHILGSAIVVMKIGMRTIGFTGDLGNSPTSILPDTDFVSGLDYLVTESVYGDRNHEAKEERRARLKEAITRVLSRQGTLLIPTFSLEKTQVLLYELNKLIEGGQVASVPVFLDSPLAIDITGVYRNYLHLFKDSVRKEIAAGDDIFQFPKLTLTKAHNDSFDIDAVTGPKIVIAASGMSGGGRILRHEVKYLPDHKNALLLIGYQSLGTLGRRIKDGEKSVKIDNQWVPVKAEIINISGYSSHKDSNNLVDFISKSASTLKTVFCVMGEPKCARFLAQRVFDELDVKAVAPEYGASYTLE